MVVIIFGLPGSGKSFFARKLSKLLHAVHINSDLTRRTLLNVPCYSVAEKESIYESMLFRTIDAVNKNTDVILDATFYTSTIRNKFETALAPLTDIVYIEMIASEEITKRRLAFNRQDSEADIGVYEMIRNKWQPLQKEHLILHSTDDNINILLLKAYHWLKQPKNVTVPDKQVN